MVFNSRFAATLRKISLAILTYVVHSGKREQSQMIDNHGRKLDKACIRFSQYVPGMSNGTDTWIAIAKLD